METEEQVLIEEKVFGPKTKLESNIDLICRVAELIHPGNWCLDISEPRLKSVVSADNRLLIKFPEVTISNGTSLTHHITDVFIAIPITTDYSKMRGNTMYMMRSSVEQVEFYNGYFHSHACRSNRAPTVENYFQWRNLCLGGQTSLTELVYALSSEGINEGVLELLLLNLHTYVRHESISGGPYFMYKNLIFPSERSRNYNSDLLKLKCYENLIDSFISDDSEEVLELSLAVIGGGEVSCSFHNTFISMPERLKRIISKLHEDGEISTTELLANMGSRDSNDNFVSKLKPGSNDYIIQSQKRASMISNLNTESILMFRGSKSDFLIRDVNEAVEEEEVLDFTNLEINSALIREMAVIYKQEVGQYLTYEEEYN